MKKKKTKKKKIEKSAEGSDPVLLNYLAFAWSFGFLGHLREGKKLDAMGQVPGLLWVGSKLLDYLVLL